MNPEPTQFLPVPRFWEKPVSNFKFQVLSFALGMVAGALIVFVLVVTLTP